jgi:stearoyl-CoA desaturase (delta-9 desaturase)
MNWTRSIPFLGVHGAAVAGVALLGWSWAGLGLALALYYLRMFFVTAGYHRYFSHRSFKTGRLMQFLLALGGTSSAQKGVLWWASCHRVHHTFTDRLGDPHSPKLRGLWWSHVGWILSDDFKETDWKRIQDFARYPELRWLNRHYLLPPVALAALLLVVGGAWALLWGFFVSTVLLWHGTFLVNSLAHLMGRRRYETRDDSRNNLLVALLAMGEGWHNNHHHYSASARQGFFWWELDPSYYLLRLLSWLGLVWDLREPPAHVREQQSLRSQRQVSALEEVTPDENPRVLASLRQRPLRRGPSVNDALRE